MTRLHVRLCLASIVLLVLLAGFGIHSTAILPPAWGESSTVFFYHNRSEIYRNENESIFMYEDADAEPPLNTDPTTTILRCSIMHQIQYMSVTVAAYVGLVQWITPALLEDYVAGGTASIHVWLSSEDVIPQISGYGMAIADLDESGNVVGNLYYNYKYADGKTLSTEPTEYSLSVGVNHLFAKDHKLAFQLIVGSTTQGWMAKVYFDSPNRNSRAILPGNAIVPEFEKGTLVLALAITVGTTLFLSRKRKMLKSTSPIQVNCTSLSNISCNQGYDHPNDNKHSAPPGNHYAYYE